MKKGKLVKISDNSHYIGVFSGGETEIVNTPDRLAAFICEAGKQDDLTVLTPDRRVVLNTFGIYIDRCPDQDFLHELLDILIPMQMEAEAETGLPRCPCSESGMGDD